MKKRGLKVRPAAFRDAEAIFALIKKYPHELLPRPIGDIVQNMDRALVCERRGEILGTVSWRILPEIGKPSSPTVELQSLCVESGMQEQGVGRALVSAAIRRVKALSPAQIIVLTFAPGFFRKMGFKRIAKRRVMHKIYMGCINCAKYHSPFTCPEIAMVINLDETAKPGG